MVQLTLGKGVLQLDVTGLQAPVTAPNGHGLFEGADSRWPERKNRPSELGRLFVTRLSLTGNRRDDHE